MNIEISIKLITILLIATIVILWDEAESSAWFTFKNASIVVWNGNF